MKPIRFNREKDARETAIKEKLIDIRTAQEAFKSVKGYYTGSFDTLITFLKTDSLPLVFKRGSLTDEMIADGITSEREAVKKGLISRDTSYIPGTRLDILSGLSDRDPPVCSRDGKHRVSDVSRQGDDHLNGSGQCVRGLCFE
ncbi:MAG: hypothetical protein MZV63_01280 [Marinilabiliales bacterium]|nr:hypothetical protein [Marinilabiliales bacterium]